MYKWEPTHVTWRPASQEEIHQFYNTKFQFLFEQNASSFIKSIRTVPEWACIDRNEKFIRGTLGKAIQFQTFDELKNFLIENGAISAYYGTGSLFTVDIDAKDVAKYAKCEHHPKFGDLKEGSPEFISRLDYIRNLNPRNYPYCFNCISLAIKGIHKLKQILLEIGIPENEILVYFSGQGAHLECTYPRMTELKKETRGFLASYFTTIGIPVDKVVTYGDNRVLRIPGSLHGKVNRIKTLLKPGEEFNVITTGVI
ncbi:hypothetical protein Metho_2511 (plasmid) [Methanomethylovorans hollandica DSM 15978]|uniref:DNA primase n=1 Tax=Methanomethylovorans hollandica (strain DSM 15978 / NBRC 107637 / DMS1) TaxID=867904 RepID=L0KZW5_METHD|nr:hypothetical protein Metho_2511 [Methanomethylovorans hollandica DSM 15978]